MINTKKTVSLLILLFFIGLIIATILWFSQFRYGHLIQSGDLRLHTNPGVIGDQFLHLVSRKFSTNNFIYLSFYPLFLLLKYIPYPLILTYIFLIIPAVLFFSFLFLLLKTTHFSFLRTNTANFFFLSTLALYFVINPAFFNRLGHFTILHATIFLPLIIYSLYCFLLEQKVSSFYLFLFLVTLYLGSSVPQMLVVNNLTVTLMYFALLITSKPNLLTYLKKGILIGIVILFSQLHIIYPAMIGLGTTKSSFESATTALVLNSFARNSNLFTSISGTNYYYDELIQYPSPMSAGLVIFILTLVLLIIYGLKNSLDKILLASSLLSLIAATGYKTFPLLYDLLNSAPLKSFTWLLKDPNMYYLVFLTPLLLLFSRLVLSNITNRFIILILSTIILIPNLFFVFLSDKKEYNRFYDFINIPNHYSTVSEKLNQLGGRNYWIPYNTYISKDYSKDIAYFPNPALWLTRNRELTDQTSPYQELIATIENEVFMKGCKNTYFLGWIIAAQDLNVIVDHHSVNNLKLGVNDTEDKVKQASACLENIPDLQKAISIELIDVYRSNLKLKDVVYHYKGSIEGLNTFLANNQPNVIFETSTAEGVEKLSFKEFTILNESFDSNWRNLQKSAPDYKVNLASMLFLANTNQFFYRGSQEFEWIVGIQKFVIAVSLLYLISKLILSISSLRK